MTDMELIHKIFTFCTKIVAKKFKISLQKIFPIFLNLSADSLYPIKLKKMN